MRPGKVEKDGKLFHANIHKEKACTTILITDKVDLKAKNYH